MPVSCFVLSFIGFVVSLTFWASGCRPALGDASPLDDASLHFVRWRPPLASLENPRSELSNYLPVQWLPGNYLVVGDGNPFAFFYDSDGILMQHWAADSIPDDGTTTRILTVNEKGALLETCSADDKSCRFTVLSGLTRLPRSIEHSTIFDGYDGPVIAARGIEPRDFLLLANDSVTRMKPSGETRWSFPVVADGMVAAPSGRFCLTQGNGLRCFSEKAENVLTLERGAERLSVTDSLIVAAENLGETDAFFRVYDWRGDLMLSLDTEAAPLRFDLVKKYIVLHPAGTDDCFIYKLDSNNLEFKRRFTDACGDDEGCNYYFNAYGETLELHILVHDSQRLEIAGELTDLHETSVASFHHLFDTPSLPFTTFNTTSRFVNEDVFLLHHPDTGHLLLLDLLQNLPEEMEEPYCLPVTQFRGNGNTIEHCAFDGESFGMYADCNDGAAGLGFLPICLECDRFSLPICDGDFPARVDACGNVLPESACMEGYTCSNGQCIVPPLD